jgi:hypothetical protein
MINKNKYVIGKDGNWFYVREHHDGKTVSGGRLIAFFTDEKEAKEYVEFLNNKN